MHFQREMASMELEDLSPRAMLVVALLALLPVTWYGLGASLSAGAVSAINVLIIVTCLYIAFAPIPHHGHGSNETA